MQNAKVRNAIEIVRGDLLPEDRLAATGIVPEKHGGVGIFGDGINDAPALAKVSMSFAMRTAATDTITETADVALMQDDLCKPPLLLKLSRKTSHVLA